MALTISNVTLSPQNVNTGENFTITVMVEDVSWNTVKNNFADWNEVSNELTSWNALFNHT